MGKLAEEIKNKWRRFKENCEFYNPEYHVGHPELTEEWCNNSPMLYNLVLARCSMNRCPKLK